MDIITVSSQLITSFFLGGVIGLEREVNEKKQHTSALVGLRSFALISLLGTIAGLLSAKFIIFSALICIAFFALIITLYILDSLQTKDPGITSELAMIYSFIIGFLIPINIIPIQIVIALTVLIILLLSQKQKIKSIVTGIEKNEINALISFLIIAFVILPFLPNQSFAIKDIPPLNQFFQSLPFYSEKLSEISLLNPFRLWLIVVLVTGVDFIGYVLEQFIGKNRGWLLTSAIGGFVSSTATTQSLAKESISLKSIHHLVGAAVLSNIVSFIQILILIAPINTTYFTYLLPVVFCMLISGIAIIWYLLRKKQSKVVLTSEPEKKKTIIDISFALKFAGLYILIGIVAKVALELFGNNGLFIVVGIGALAGLDAVIINTAQLAGSSITYQTAILAFILANTINIAAKCFYGLVSGAKAFTRYFAITMLIVILFSFLGLLLSTSFIK